MATPAAVLSVLVKAQGIQATTAQLKALDAAAKKAGDASDSLEAKHRKGLDAMDKVGKKAGFVALGVGAIGGAAVNAAAKYEQSMNTLQAVSGQTGAEMAKTSKLAIKLGADVRLPGTSAQDAAEAMTEMIKAGVSLKDTMAGVRSTLVLSAAAGISNAEAAEIASNALNAFKLKGKDVTMVTDQLANTANASSVEIRDVSDSFKMAAAVFSGFQAPTLGAKKAMTELNVAIGLLGNAGIKGSDAGTSLKQMLLQLTGPSNKAKAAMQALYFEAHNATIGEGQLTTILQGGTKERDKAINSIAKMNPALAQGGDIAYTAAGKMRSLKDIIALVAAGTKHMTDEQKNAYVTQIFGADATRSVIALMNAGPAAFDKMTASVTKQGSAQALADAKMKGFKGSLEALRSTLETLAINVGTKLLPSLTALVRQFTKLTSVLSPTAWMILIGVIGSLALAVWGINAAMKVYKAATVAATAAQWLFNAALSANPIGLAIIAVAALGAAIVIAYNKSKTFRDIINAVGTALQNMLINRISMVLGAFSSFLGGIAKVANALGANGLAKRASEGQHAIDDLRESLRNVPDHKDVDVKVKISLDGQSVDVTNAKPLSPTPPGGDGPGVIGSRIADKVRSSRQVIAGAKKLAADGLGAMVPGLGGATGNLMGAKAIMGPFAAVGAQFGLRVSSGLRPGAITSSGNRSLHATGNAVDLANGKGPDPAKMEAFNALRSRYGSRLAELIYTPAGGRQIKDGQNFLYTGQVARDHYDHVHVGFTGATGRGGGAARAALGDGLGRASRTGAFTGDGPGRAVRAARSAGFKGNALLTAVAVAGAESGYNSAAQNLKYPDHSIGLWQINQLAHKGRYGTDAQLKNPGANAKAAYAISGGGKNWGPWSTFTNGSYRSYLDRARAAIASGGSAPSTGGNAASGAAGAAAKVNPFDQKVASADLAIAQAQKATGSIKVGSGRGARKISAKLGQISALTAKRQLIGKRIQSIRKKLKEHLSSAKRLSLTQELTQRLGEHADLGKNIADLRKLPDPSGAGGDVGSAGGSAGGGDGSDPNQALIDSNAALQAAMEAQAEAAREHAEALKQVRSEIKRQTDFANSVAATSSFQLTKTLADLLSGQIVGYGVAGRAFTPGSGVRASY